MKHLLASLPAGLLVLAGAAEATPLWVGQPDKAAARSVIVRVQAGSTGTGGAATIQPPNSGDPSEAAPAQERTGVPKANIPANAPQAGQPLAPRLDGAQRYSAHRLITQQTVERVARPAFDVSVGTIVPRDTVLREMPAEVTQVAPPYRSMKYLLVDPDTVVVIEPSSYRIVDILKG